MIQEKRLVKTKKVATLGPSSSSHETIKALVEAGVNVFRLNFSHGTHEEHVERIHKIRSVEKETGVKVSILQDLQGPKIRLGKFKEDKVTLKEGQEFTITSQETLGNEKIASVTFGEVIKDVKKGERIFVNDGMIRLIAEKNNGREIVTKIIQGGEVSDNKGLNFPDTSLSLMPISEKDVEDLSFGLSNGVDLVALSFVRNAEDIVLLKRYMEKFGRIIPVIAKIERWEAVKNIDEIARESESIMVARGDLGIELPIEKIPIIQKEIISICNNLGKPVITATQMLNSLVDNLTPTRAEVTDVANAIFDGTDSVMLSNETAVGHFPVEAVRVMHNIIEETEFSEIFYNHIINSKDTFEENISDAIAFSATEIAKITKAKLIICATESGKTATLISKHKPNIPILALTPCNDTLRYLNLKWGVYPHLVKRFKSVDEILKEGPKAAIDFGFLLKGDTYVITAGSHAGISGSTNLLKVDKA